MNKKNFALAKTIYVFIIGIATLLNYSCKSTDKMPVDQELEKLAGKAAYDGSVFKELKAKVWGTPYLELPSYKVEMNRIISHEFKKNSARTVDLSADLIDSDRPKIVHPNGLCLAGVWSIANHNIENPYSGYFANGSKGLIIARASTAGTNVDVDENNFGKLTGDQYISYGLTGKIFPTTNAEDPKQYRPANFITQTDLGGQLSADFSDVEFLNAPNVTALNRGAVGGGVKIFAITGLTFASVDESTTIRQLYEIAELDKPTTVKTSTPKYLKIVASPAHRKKLPKGDFRVTLHNYIQREKVMSFDILVANEGFTKKHTQLKQQTIVTDAWKKIGTVTFYDTVASKTCDFNLHFHHPAWRTDGNDPGTVARH